jgi:tetratricopeptide (TPR) repeat protein
LGARPSRRIEIDAETLGVAHVLEGGLQKAGDRLRVRVRLVDARDGSTRWAETYDRELRDVFTVQDEIARAVARELGVRLGLPNRAVVRRQPTRNVAAYEFYLKGSDRTLLRSDSAVRVGLEFFRQAIALDSNYAGAWAGLGRMYSRLAAAAPPRDKVHLSSLAETAARRAIALDDSLDETHASLGAIWMSRRQYAEAERELSRAIELEPNRALTHQWISALYISMGQLHKALAHAERALELDPLAPDTRADLARALAANDRCDEALVHLKPLASLKPPLLRVAPIAAHCYAKKGMWPEAIAAIRPQAQRAEPTAQAHLAYLLGRAGQKEEALSIRATLLDEWRRGEIGAFQVALSYAGLDERDRAFEWLDRSVDDQSFEGAVGGQFRALLSDQLSNDPRFGRLEERLRRPDQKR